MTASSPLPAGSEVCRCGLPEGTAVHGNPFGAGHTYDPRPPAPDTTGGELREAIVHVLSHSDAWQTGEVADRILALPALRDLLAERDKLAAQVRAGLALAEELEAGVRKLLGAARWDSEPDIAKRMRSRGLARQADAELFRRALGTPTTGGGE